jgi:GNAT superfamily N-acetyltransferase
MMAGFQLRLATHADVPGLRVLIDISVRQLQVGYYAPSQLEKALANVYGVDTQLIKDGTYFAVEAKGAQTNTEEQDALPGQSIVGCGGWSKRKTLYGGDQATGRDNGFVDPGRDAAKIRAFFVHPKWTRCGVASIILEACEAAARCAGFSRLEAGATLTGVPFFSAKGYVALENFDLPLPDRELFPLVRMIKRI